MPEPCGQAMVTRVTPTLCRKGSTMPGLQECLAHASSIWSGLFHDWQKQRKHCIPEASLSYSEGKGHANLHLVPSQDMRTASEVVGTNCKEQLAAAALAPEKEPGDEPAKSV